MAHYAFLDENNIVTQVIVGKDEGDIDWELYYSQKNNVKCKRTSYNTYGGIHKNGGTPFRKNYATIGGFYDEQRDAFIPPKEHDSFILDEDTCLWVPPIPYPNDGKDYRWDDLMNNWELIQTIRIN